MSSILVKCRYLFDTNLLKLKGAKVSGYAYIRGKVEIAKAGSLTLEDGVVLRGGANCP